MRTLRPPQLAHQVTHSTATLDNDSHHVHPSAGQQNIPELLNSPVTARPLQQPPKAPRRKPPPPYSAAPYPYCRSIPREGHRPTGSCARSPAGNQDHPRSPHGNAESNLLHLLANSNPIRSPDELLARLKSAATAAATAAASPIPACMQTQHDSDGLTGNRPTCDALTHRHNQLLLAPTELPQRLSTPAVSGSSPLLSRGRAPGPALQHNSPGWQQQTGSRVWEAPAVDHHSSHGLHLHRGGHGHGHGGIANAATQLQAGKLCTRIEAM